MANSISNISDGLTYIGRSLLRNLQSRNLLIRRVNTAYFSGWSYGSTFSVPSLDVSGGAAVRAIGGAATADDIVSLTRTFTKAQIYKAVRVDNLQMLFSSVDLLAEVGQRLAYKVAKKCDSIVAGLWNQIPYEVGTLDGTTAIDITATSDQFKALNDARVILMQNDADMDNLTAVFNPFEASQFRRIPLTVQANTSGSTEMLRNAGIGNLLGFDILESQQIQNATTSVAAETNSPGAVNNVAGYPANTVTMDIDAIGAGSVKAGTTFTIAGLLNDEGYSVGFVVTTDATIAANAATITFNPPLPATVADNAVITFREHTAAGSQNLVFHSDAIVAAIQGMANFMPGTGVSVSNVTDEQTGLSVQIAMESNLLGAAGVAYSTAVAASIVFGAGVARPELAVRISGRV